LSKITERESLDQAEEHHTIIGHAERSGLCLRCAVQFANGTQLGFANAEKPCDGCAMVILDWPSTRPNGWRTIPGTVSRAAAWRNYPQRRQEGA
jgi:hypothetical protein